MYQLYKANSLLESLRGLGNLERKMDDWDPVAGQPSPWSHRPGRGVGEDESRRRCADQRRAQEGAVAPAGELHLVAEASLQELVL